MIAKIVRSINILRTDAGSFSGVDLKPGNSGKLSFETPGRRNFDLSHSTVTQSFSSLRKLTGASGSKRAMSKSLRAGTQIAPCVEISCVSASHLIVTSRSVPLMRIESSPADSMRMFAKTGMVFLRSTIPCTNANSFCKAFRAITNCICCSLR